MFLIISEIEESPVYDKNKQENDREIGVEFESESMIYQLLLSTTKR